ncbi:MAG: TonB-dependent receptor, partial [Chitinophagales bacterium]|nr:TonB-dependent receptor [Chitinophagales bacterium]
QRNWELQAGYNFYSRKKAAYRKDLVTLTQQEREGEAQLNTLGEWSVRSTLSGMLWKQQLSWQAGVDLNGQQATGDRLHGDRKKQSDLAVFGTLEYQATPSLSLRPGLRLAHNAYGVPLTPALNLRYDFSKHIHLRAGLARGFRAPSLKERYLYFYDSNHSIYGNPDLKAEQSFSANMFWLFEYVMGAVQLNSEVAVAYNDISNLINLSLVNALEQEYTYINVGQYRTRTATVQTEAHWNSLRLHAGFMLQAISHSLSDTLTTDGFVIAPEYRFQIMAGQPDRNLRVALLFRRTAPMPAFSTDAAGVVYEKIAPAYNLLDLTLSRSLWQQRLSLHAGINNILNVKDVPNLSSSTAIHSSQDAIPVAVGRYAFLGIKLNVIGP